MCQVSAALCSVGVLSRCCSTLTGERTQYKIDVHLQVLIQSICMSPAQSFGMGFDVGLGTGNWELRIGNWKLNWKSGLVICTRLQIRIGIYLYKSCGADRLRQERGNMSGLAAPGTTNTCPGRRRWALPGR